MPMTFSPSVPAREIQMGDNSVFSSISVDLAGLGRYASPVLTLDHYRLTGAPFLPHPHAGFTAIAYVLQDSETNLRSRDVLGNDVITDAGGLLITEAGSGVVHEDTTLDLTKEMHGVQFFINHSQPNKFRKPRIQQVLAADIPVWTGPEGDTVRVVLGSFGGLDSPAELAEPANMLDVQLKSSISCPLGENQNLVVFVTAGQVDVTVGGEAMRIAHHHSIGVGDGPGDVVISAVDGPAVVMVVSGAAIDAPYIRHMNAFFFNSQDEIYNAIARYEAGEMGKLVPRGELG
ncbi:MAG: hypothetical protein RL481_116 [Pseudomonadota bacterium]